jgi:hypothetical protein
MVYQSPFCGLWFIVAVKSSNRKGERRFMNSRVLTVVAVLFLASSAFAAEQPALSDADKAKATELIKKLGADDFNVRSNSADELSKMNAGIVPLLRDAAATTTDAEVKSQLVKLLKKWALESETDPAVLSKYGREEALAKKYTEAAPYYEKAAKLYTAAAAKETNAEKKSELEDEAKTATVRAKRAALMSKVKMEMNTGGRVVAGGAGGGGGMVVVHKFEVSGDAGEGVNLMSEDW